MKRTWTRVGLPTLLVAALAASPTFAHDGEPDKTDAILLQLKNLTKSVQELKGMPSNLTDLNKKIGEVEKRLADQLASQEVNATVRMQALQRELNTLKDQHAQMKLELEALRTRPLTKQPTVSLYPPGNGSTTTGRLRLVNTFPEQISIAVNNRPAYRVEPNEVVWVEGMPSGQFTYEVLGIQSKLSRSLTAGETFTIHVYPR